MEKINLQIKSIRLNRSAERKSIGFRRIVRHIARLLSASMREPLPAWFEPALQELKSDMLAENVRKGIFKG